MALVGLRDGIDLELWRLERSAQAPRADQLAAARAQKAQAAYEDALARFASGDLAACLVRVTEALRLSPEHRGASELEEKLREAVVERARFFENETETNLDTLVAAFLAFDKGEVGGPGEAARAGAARPDQEKITSLSEFLLAEPPESRGTRS
jgi:hypothetical protein